MEHRPSQNEAIDGRFILNQQLSQGSVGSIWSAVQMPQGRAVALKLLRPEVASLPHLRRRFAREARAASRLFHTNIATIVDHGVASDGQMFIAMELLDGEVVTEFIRRGLSLTHILDLADQLLAGLAHAHAKGVIHRDLKPANLMVIDSDLPRTLGTVKIVDFGIAQVQSDGDVRETAHGEVVGTPRYMSPEQASGERQLGPGTDLYNVGLILYELIAGRPPFGDEKGLSVMSSHVHQPIPPLIPRADLEVPAQLIQIVMKALEKDPARRWTSAAAMRSEIRVLLERAQADPNSLRVPAPVEGFAEEEHSTVEESVVTRPLEAELIQRAFEEATEESPAAMHGAVINPQQRIPFVGREDERERLEGIVKSVLTESRGKIVLLQGEAGVGKTRLAMWVKERVEEEGLLRGHIGAFTRGSAEGMQGLREVLDSIFGTRRLPRAQVQELLEQRLGHFGYTDELDIQRIADFMRPAGPDSVIRPLPLEPGKLFAVIARVLERAAAQGPRLIILDDLHWANAEVGDFLDYMAVEMRHRSIPLMIMGTIRTEDLGENPALARRLDGLSRYTGESVERLHLSGLTAESGRQLVRYVLPVEDDLCDAIFERSGGNPLHLVLMLRYLGEEGLLTWDGARWIARDERAVRAAVPPSLADLFRVRLLQVEARHGSQGRIEELLQRAAIAGPRFTYDVLRAMVEAEGEAEGLAHFDDDFDRLLDEGLLIESHGRREEWYAFSHGVVRDFFLSRVGGAHRARRFHRYAAIAREKTYGAKADMQAAEIGAHWEAARDREKALYWYQRAAQTAERAAMYRQAATASTAALRLMDELLGLTEFARQSLDIERLDELCSTMSFTARQYVELAVQLGDLHEGFGEYDKAEGYYRRVVRMVGARPMEQDWVIGALAQAWLGLGHLAWQRGDFEAAKWAFERVCRLVEGVEALEEVRASALRGLSQVAWHRGDYEEARALGEAALESARRRGDISGEARALWGLGEVARIRGDSESARQRFLAAQELYARASQPIGFARAVLSRAQVARYQKNFLQAEELYQRALRRYQALGHRRGMAQCLNGLGDVARFGGDFAAAQTFYQRALDLYEAMGAQYDVALVYTNLGLTAMGRSDFEDAKRFMEAARRLLAPEDYPYLQAGLELNLALVEEMRGDHKLSEELLERVMDLSERFPIPDLDYARPLEELGKLRSEAGYAEKAMKLWERARRIYSELSLPEDQARMEQLIARLAEESQERS